jgi:hypothetical protein
MVFFRITPISVGLFFAVMVALLASLILLIRKIKKT